MGGGCRFSQGNQRLCVNEGLKGWGHGGCEPRICHCKI